VEVLSNQSLLAPSFISHMNDEPFVLIDVGCSGGISDEWRAFEPYLHAYGFDPNIQECLRLQSAEKNDEVKYISGFVGLSPDHPFKQRWEKEKREFTTNSPWDRLAVARTSLLQKAKHAALDHKEKTEHNHWASMELADSDNTIFLDQFVRENDINSVDFIKIDVDGADFEVMHSLEADLKRLGVLGVVVEVNWIGTDHPAEHSFHNTDRFMRAAGYDLYDITMRRYSMVALPGRYDLTIPAQGLIGRPLQGDALYLRDLAAPQNTDLAAAISIEKILKLAVLFEIAGQPDSAADLILTFSERLNRVINVSEALDTLASGPAFSFSGATSFDDHVNRFENDDPSFYR